MDITRTAVKSIECLGEVDDYVYDLSIADQDPFFFANDILVHNTDSCYFTAWPMIKDDVANGIIPWDKDICIQLYDSIADQVNNSFPAFMEQAFHCPREAGELIKAGRELVASNSLFITKKRYAVLIYDLENKRLDVDGKPGKIKAMGLDLKRSDTPKFVQEFLYEILEKVLIDIPREEIIERIREFKHQFAELPAWEKGTPKRVNNLTSYGLKEKEAGKANLPGHVRAAINWNHLRQVNNDKYSMKIVDGMKTIVCKLRPNPLGWTSIGFPTDELHLPQWFKDLPFDEKLMEATIVDQKIDNLLGDLDWDLTSQTNTDNTFQSLFDF